MQSLMPQYTPMAPTRVREPFYRAGWVYEEKVDGWRMLAYKDGERDRLMSRNGRDHTRRFADLAAAVAKLSARTLVLDGEVAIYDQQLRSEECPARSPPAGVTTRWASIAGSLVRFVGLSLQERPSRKTLISGPATAPSRGAEPGLRRHPSPASGSFPPTATAPRAAHAGP